VTGQGALIISAVVGALVTAFGTAGATWFVSNRLERQQERHRLSGSAAVILAEIEDNRTEIERSERKEISDADLRDGRLTIGDWTANKQQLGALRLNDVELWRDLTDLYSALHATVRLHAEPPPSVRLKHLESRLARWTL